MIEISLEQAQRFILEKQGLLTTKPAKSVLEVARRIHNVQIDTISVVARSHDLTIYNRFENYTEKEIWDNLRRKELFEYYSHGLCLIPIEDYPFYKLCMDDYRDREKNSRWEKWLTVNQKIVDFVLNRVKKEGPLSSKDFKVPEERKSKGWFEWKEEKRALEYLFYRGDLLINHREGFQKYYDIPERVLPLNISHEPMSIKDAPDYLLNTTLSSLGICDYEEIKSYIRSRTVKLIWNNKPSLITEYLEEKVKDDTLIKVNVQGIDRTQFIKSTDSKKIETVKSLESAEAKLINPFDNVARDRNLLRKFWNYDYKLEAYTPAPDRIFGYYLMPILIDHQIVGRLEPKVHRKESRLEIKSIFFENWFKPSINFYEKLAKGLWKFATFHNCTEITLNDNINKDTKNTLTSVL